MIDRVEIPMINKVPDLGYAPLTTPVGVDETAHLTDRSLVYLADSIWSTAKGIGAKVVRDGDFVTFYVPGQKYKKVKR